jgi:hypothetical protein
MRSVPPRRDVLASPINAVCVITRFDPSSPFQTREAHHELPTPTSRRCRLRVATLLLSRDAIVRDVQLDDRPSLNTNQTLIGIA